MYLAHYRTHLGTATRRIRAVHLGQAQVIAQKIAKEGWTVVRVGRI